MANKTIYPYGTDGQLPSSIGVINDVETGGTTDALSAEQGKNLGYNVQLLVEQLADSAFIGERPDLKDVRSALSETVSVTIETANASASDNKTSCVLGASYHNTLLNDRGYVIDSVVVTMGGVDITSTSWDAEKRTVSIEKVTGAITISCNAIVNTNPHYYQLRYRGSDTAGSFGIDQEENSLLTKKYPLAGDYSKVVTFNSGSVSRTHHLILLNDDGSYCSYAMDNASPRTVTIGPSSRGMRLNCTYSLIDNAVLINETDKVNLFDGKTFNLADSIDGISFFDQFLNGNGDLVGIKAVLTTGVLQFGPLFPTEDFITSKLIEIPADNRTVEFSVGAVDSVCGICALSSNDAVSSSYKNYWTANSSPRSVSLSTGQYTKINYIRLLTKKEYYANSYVKIGGTIVWQGTNEFVE